MPHRHPSLPADTPRDHAPGNGRDTDRLKHVPPTKELREQVRQRATALAVGLDKSRPMARHEMEALARDLLRAMDLPEGFLGWTMVALASAFWEDQVAAVPAHRRLLLLPRCLRDE